MTRKKVTGIINWLKNWFYEKSEINNSEPEYLVGTHGTNTTASWTGTCSKLTQIKDGTVIFFYLTSAGTTNVTLNLTLANGTSTGAKNVYFKGTTRLSTQYPINSIVALVYTTKKDNGAWYVISANDNNSWNSYEYGTVQFIAGENLTARTLCGAKSDGKYYMAKSGVVFDTSYPIFFTNGAVNKDTNSNNMYMPRYDEYITNTVNSLTLTSGKPVYLEGTSYVNGQFTISSNIITQTLTNGRYYWLIGFAYSTTSLRTNVYEKIFYFNGTNLIPVEDSKYAPTTHNHASGDITGLTASKNVVTNSSGKLATEEKNNHTHSDIKITYDASTSNSVTTIDQALYEEFNANRLAFLDKNNIIAEYSTDGGSTWTTFPSSRDSDKVKLVTTQSNFLAGNNATASANNQVRITLDAGGTYNATNANGVTSAIYMVTRKLFLYFSSNGGSNCKCKVETSPYGDPTTWTVKGEYTVAGYSGWNSIPLYVVWGGYPSQLTGSRIRNIRLTFTNESAKNVAIQKIRMVGETCYVPTLDANSMASNGHIYKIDENKNATFPNKIIKSGGTSGQFLKADGSVDSNDYSLKNHTHGSITNDGKVGNTAGKVITTGDGGVLQASNSIGTSQIADNSITTAKISNGTITNDDIANKTIQGGKVADGTLANYKFNLTPMVTTNASTTSAFVVSNSNITAYYHGLIVAVLNNKGDNLDDATLQVNSLGAKPIYYKNRAIRKGEFPFRSFNVFVYTGDWSHLNDGAGSWTLLDLPEQSTLIPNGKSESNKTDLNDYKTPGFYHTNANEDMSYMDNAPLGAVAFSMVVLGGTIITQIATTYHSTNPRTFVRTFNDWANPQWGSWFELSKTNHGHGKLSSGGVIEYDIESIRRVAVTDTNRNLRTIEKVPFANLNITKANITGLGISASDHTHSDYVVKENGKDLFPSSDYNIGTDTPFTIFVGQGQYANLYTYLNYIYSKAGTIASTYAPMYHATNNSISADNYGKATTSNWGHVKLDSTPTNGSSNAVTSDGIYDALSDKTDIGHGHSASDSSYSPSSDWGEYQQVVNSVGLALDTLITLVNPATLPLLDNVSQSSSNPVKSSGIYTALSGKEDKTNYTLIQTITKTGVTAKVYSDGKNVYIKFSGAPSSAIANNTSLNMGTITNADYSPKVGYEYNVVSHNASNIIGAVLDNGTVYVVNRSGASYSGTVYGGLMYPLKSRLP